MDSDDNKATESENGSDNSYVQVSSEDAQLHMEPGSQLPLHDSPQLLSGSGMTEEGDFPFGEGDNTITTPPETVQTSDVKVEDPFYMKSHDPEEELASSPVESLPTKVGGVEEVHSAPSDPAPSTTLSAPKATGYLCFLNYLHPAVLYLIYWQDPKLSAVVLGVDMVVLLTLNMNTLLHTLVLLLLSFLVVSLTYIVTKIAIDSFYNRSVRNPFSDYLSKNIVLPEEKILDWTRYLVGRLNKVFNVLVRLLLFDNIQRSLKFGLMLWLVSFVTNCLSFMTTAIIVVAFLFAAPPIYSRHQLPIDHVIKNLLCKSLEMFQMVKSRIPFLTKRKVE